MRKVPIPKLSFSKWRQWDNRTKFPLKDFPGIYLIAITTKNLEDKTARFSDVVYIGMATGKKGLKGRWRAFQTAINKGTGHSGGNKIHSKRGKYKKWCKCLNLYVSAMGIKCDVTKPTKDDYIKMGWVAFLEYEAFAKYYKKFHKLPKYNTLHNLRKE